MGAARRRFTARMTALEEALAFVRDTCQGAGIDMPDMLRLSLVVEELFTNTVEHGGGDHTSVGIALRFEADHLVVGYDDDAPAFNPLRVPAPDLDLPLAQREPGGLGVHLVRELSDELRYRRERGRNRLRLRMLRSPAAPGSR